MSEVYPTEEAVKNLEMQVFDSLGDLFEAVIREGCLNIGVGNFELSHSGGRGDGDNELQIDGTLFAYKGINEKWIISSEGWEGVVDYSQHDFKPEGKKIEPLIKNARNKIQALQRQ